MGKREENCYNIKQIKDLSNNYDFFYSSKEERIRLVLGHWDFEHEVDLQSKVPSFKIEELIVLLRTYI